MLIIRSNQFDSSLVQKKTSLIQRGSLDNHSLKSDQISVQLATYRRQT